MVSLLSTRPDFSSLTEVTVLPEASIEQAMRRCQNIPNSDEQWDCYLRSLAFAGVGYWLDAGSTPFTVGGVTPQPPRRTSCLEVNGWRVGIALINSVPLEAMVIPQAAVQGPSSIQLWLLVEVQEELGHIQVLRGLAGTKVADQAAVLNAEGNFIVPFTAFTLTPDQILLQLDHLAPTAMPSAQTQSAPDLGRLVMNAGRWLSDQLDDVAQQFAWTLLDPLTPAGALRSPTQELESILAEVRPQGITIPGRARAAFSEVPLATVPLRLYALIWSVFEGADPEWSLLVFLGPSPGDTLPPGLVLRIRDDATVLVEETFTGQSEATYLYAQVFGTWEETFSLEIVPPHSPDPLILPAFGFQPEV